LNPARIIGWSSANIVLFISDQERAIQQFPPGWAPGATYPQRQRAANRSNREADRLG
jgi:hypothetical protein